MTAKGNKTMQVYKFSESATAQAPKITEKELIDQMKNGDRFVFGTDNLLHHGVFKINGWAFVPKLNKYVIKQYDDLYEVYAPNKTSLRRLVCGRIKYIVEVK